MPISVALYILRAGLNLRNRLEEAICFRTVEVSFEKRLRIGLFLSLKWSQPVVELST